MISQKYRFHSRGGVQFVQKNGRRVRGKLLGLTFLANTGRKTSRLAVVVSKKVTKSAVTRNRIRRRVFEVLRTEVLPMLKTSCDLIFFVSDAEVAEMDYGKVVEEVRELLRKAGIRRA